MTFKEVKDKIVTHLVSWKFNLLVLSTYLFIKGTLSENGWLLIAASTTGLRELMNLLTLRLGGSVPAASVKVDNPDQKV